MAYCGEFDFDLGEGVARHLLTRFARLRPGPLDEKVIKNSVQNKSGVYLILRLVRGGYKVAYVGKTNTSLRARLRQHLRTIASRKQLRTSDFAFKGLYVGRTWRATGPEEVLIDFFKKKGQAEWNSSGFGAKDPGRHRDSTEYTKKGHFNKKHSIRTDHRCVSIKGGSYPAEELLKMIKKEVPYFRGRLPAKLSRKRIVVARGGMPADSLLRKVAKTLKVMRLEIGPNQMRLYSKNDR